MLMEKNYEVYGNTMVCDENSAYLLEFAKDLKPVLKNISKNKLPTVRTNHTLHVPDGGYSLADEVGIDYISTKTRKAVAEVMFKNAGDVEALLDSLNYKLFGSHSAYDTHRDTSSYKTVSQIAVDPANKKLYYRPIPGRETFNGVERTGDTSIKPSAEVVVLEYGEPVEVPFLTWSASMHPQMNEIALHRILDPTDKFDDTSGMNDIDSAKISSDGLEDNLDHFIDRENEIITKLASLQDLIRNKDTAMLHLLSDRDSDEEYDRLCDMIDDFELKTMDLYSLQSKERARAQNESVELVAPGNAILVPPPPSEDERVKELPLIASQFENRVNDPRLQDALDADVALLFNTIVLSAGHSSIYEEIVNLRDSIKPIIIAHKEHFNALRPNELAKKRGIDFKYDYLDSAQTPSYPSGHAAQAHYIALNLSEIFPDLRQNFLDLSEMVSQSRIDRAVHFPSDVSAGKKLGEAVYNAAPIWGMTAMPVKEDKKRKPRKKGQHRNSPSHSDLYTDENPKGTIHGLKFATVKDAKASVAKIRGSKKSHAHKTQAAIAMEQRAKSMGKKSAAAVYRKFINQQKKKTAKKNENKNESVLREYIIELMRLS